MDASPKSIEVRNNTEASQYEVNVDGYLAKIEYILRDDRIIFVHTEVPDELGGQGIASKMAHYALEDVKAQGYKVVPRCPFVRGYIERHPEYQALVQ
ncbi:MAG: N-acetyltransferase [Anaerolineales bacterium]|nr:N-acetyltransferase [Anaerolineales bacterium]